MPLFRGFARIPAWTMFALFAIGCGQTSFSPTSPSSTSGRAGSSGAVITGTVSGMTFSTASLSDSFTTAAVTKPVTVTVVGTNISSVISGNSTFHLDNVPPGDVQLRFTATGLDATLMLANVKAGDRIDIKVRVTDTSVRIEAERREHDDDDDEDDNDDDEITGVVSGLTGTCPEITFSVNGATVKTHSATRFDDGTCAQVRNNVRVEVEGIRQSDGSLRATHVELED